MRILIALALCNSAFGACVAVGPSSAGSGDGSSWTNRRSNLAATLTRGNTYYLMDGTYGSYNFTTAASGTTRIIIKKAQSYDYGRTADGCSNDISAGWNAGTMGSAQAGFTSIGTSGQYLKHYLTIDGNGTSTKACGTSPMASGTASDCGIKFTNTGAQDGAFSVGGSYDGFVQRTNGWTIRYVEWQGGGDNPSTEQNGIWCTDGCDDLLMENVWWHESGTDFLKLPASINLVVRNSHFKQNFDNSTYHGQFYIQEGNSSNLSFYGNVIQDIQGTSYWSMLTGAQTNGLYVYNNVIVKTSGSSRGETSNGIFACINSGAKCENIYFVGNNVINAAGGYPTQGLGINSENNNGCSYIWKNNIFYNTGGIGFNLNGATFTEDHNSWLNTDYPGTIGTADVEVLSGAANPFVNWTGYNFLLASDAANWNNRVVVGSPYEVDAIGVSRTSSRGAYQFTSGGSSAPTVTTTAASSITTTTASAGGNVTADGGASVTARGTCRGTSVNPTTAGTCTSDGTGTGSFTSSLTGMSASTLYHIRAFATNSVGTSYGSDLTFTTSAVNPPTGLSVFLIGGGCF